MQTLDITNQTKLEPKLPPRKLRVILHSNLLLSLYTCCESETVQPLKSLFTLVYAGEIIPYIEDRQLESLKDYIREFAPKKAVEMIEELEADFSTYSVTKEDFKQVASLKLDSFSAAIALACANRLDIDVVILDSVQITSDSHKIPVLKPEEFLLRYDCQQGKLKDIVVHNSSQPPVESHISTDNDNENPESVVHTKFGDWNVENFETTILLNSDTKASVMLWNSKLGKSINRHAVGNGPVDALVKAFSFAMQEALPKAEFPPPRVDHVHLQSAGSGSDSQVLAQVTISTAEERLFSKKFTHTDTVKAVFCACLKAIAAFLENNISDEDCYNASSAETFLSAYRKSPQQQKILLLKAKLDDQSLPGLRLSDFLIVQSSLNRAVVSVYDQNEAEWSKVKISLSDLIDSDFDSAKLYDLEINDSRLEGSNFLKAKLINARVGSSNFSGVHFGKSKIEYCTFYTCQFVSAQFNDAELNNVMFSCANFKDADFTEVKIKMSYFFRAKLTGANFTEAKICSANFMRANLEGANFEGANLSRTSLALANLKGANFTNCDLRDVNLAGANLKGANLKGAILSEEQLRFIDLEDVDKSVADIVDYCGGRKSIKLTCSSNFEC